MEVISNFGNKIEKIYLYGSYARGDYDDDSDIDIMILVNEEDERKIEKLLDDFSDIAYDIEKKYNFDIFISPDVENITKFIQKKDISFLFTNILKEGAQVF